MTTDILVTGGNGLVGFALRQLNLPNITFLTRDEVDLTDFNAVQTAFGLLKPKQVIHLAAVVGGLGSNMGHSGEYFFSNAQINTNVLEAARRVNVKKLISFMSTCVFPDECEYPLRVENLHNGSPHPSNAGYAYAKRMLDIQSNVYRKQWNCNYVTLIPANIYGPNDNFSLTDGHVVPSLIHKCYMAKQNKRPLEVWGSGKPLREFLYVDDVAKLTMWALDNYDEDVPLIISSGKEVSIRDLVENVVAAMEFDGDVVWQPEKPEGQFRKPSDASKLEELCPDFTFTSLPEGISKTVQWFNNVFPHVRR